MLEKNIDSVSNDSNSVDEQYSLKKILIIWTSSALPMALLAFVVTPGLIPVLKLPPLIIYWLAINLGLIWQFVLSLIILKLDGHIISWSTFQNRMMFQRPRNPKTGKSSNRLFLWVIPFILLSAVVQSGIGFPDMDRIAGPLLKNFVQYDMSNLSALELEGEWWILGMFMVTMVFNYLLGEEFLYRGILLPKMGGVFGKWDWFANGILFGFYHLHKPQIIISTSLLFGFIFSYPSKLFRSTWMAVIIHGLEGILGLIIVLRVIMGIM